MRSQELIAVPVTTTAPTSIPISDQPLRITRHHLWLDVGIPFLATRMALLLVGWFSRYFPPSPDYPLQDAVARGWHFSPYRLLDIWGRWDTGWYISIVRDGYMLRGDLAQQQSNVSFFPFYPYLVRAILWPVPVQWQSDGVVLLAGVILSNLFLLGGLIFLYLLTVELTQTRNVAQRAVLYLLLFPTAFFFSAFYTDAAFLFLSVAALYAAQRRAWAWAALAAALLGITRPLGVLIIPVLAWLYLSSSEWRINKIRADFLWLLLTPLPFLLYLVWIGQATGDFLAPMSAQQAYFRSFAWPWTTMFAPVNANLLMTPLEQVAGVLFLGVALIACWQLPSTAYGLWVIALIMPPLFTGTMTSFLRYVVVAVPVFILLAQWGARPMLDRFLQTLLLALQIMLMVAWSQFYWVA
jgi:hypothetical protein